MKESSTEKLPLSGKELQEFRDKSFDWFIGLLKNSSEPEGTKQDQEDKKDK